MRAAERAGIGLGRQAVSRAGIDLDAVTLSPKFFGGSAAKIVMPGTGHRREAGRLPAGGGPVAWGMARLLRIGFPVLLLIALSRPVLPQTEPPAPAAVPVVKATDTDRLRDLAGQEVCVEGTVIRIGTTTAGGITFLNMSPAPNGFVAVVFQSAYQQFPEGFEQFSGKTVKVTGTLKLYRETTPQIVIEAPDQIAIVAAATEPEPSR
jgi:hypothetical protein